jgi:methionyl-tRNA synthetase
MAADLAPPQKIFAHGWWTNEGEKISKSLGNVIDPLQLVEKYGLDAVRYFLLREVPFGNDGDFSHKAMIARMNGELANDFGNLAQRVLSMIHKNCDACVPSLDDLIEIDQELLKQASDLLESVRASLDRQAFHEALEKIWAVIRASNAYVDHQAPWALRKTDTNRMKTVLYVLVETIRQIALLMQPFTPESMMKLLDQLSVDPDKRSYAFYYHRLVSGTALPAPSGVFPRFQDEVIDAG